MTNSRVALHLGGGGGWIDRTSTTATNPVPFACVLFNAFSKLCRPEGPSGLFAARNWNYLEDIKASCGIHTQKAFKIPGKGGARWISQTK